MTSTETPSAGMRHTRQRSLVASVLDATDQWLTAQQVHHRLVERGQPVGLATVYRTLTAMAEAGEIDAIHTMEWSYRRCSREHHHHLTCRRCGRTVEVAAPPLEDWANQVAAANGYSDIGHVIELSGVCPSCQD